MFIAVRSAQHQLIILFSFNKNPLSYNWIKAYWTFLLGSLSIVKYCLDKSKDSPSFLFCSIILCSYSSFYSLTHLTKSSLVKSFQYFPTTFCVAIPAWSVPGTHKETYPRNLLYIVILFSIAPIKVWPKCKLTIILG